MRFIVLVLLLPLCGCLAYGSAFVQREGMVAEATWYSPRQIIILEKLLCAAKAEMFDGIEAEAYEDMLGLIKSEAEIKRKKYL